MLAGRLGGPPGTSKVDTYELVNSTVHSSRKRPAYYWIRGASQVCPSPYVDSAKGLYVFTCMDFHRRGRWMGIRKSSSG